MSQSAEMEHLLSMQDTTEPTNPGPFTLRTRSIYICNTFASGVFQRSGDKVRCVSAASKPGKIWNESCGDAYFYFPFCIAFISAESRGCVD